MSCLLQSERIIDARRTATHVAAGSCGQTKQKDQGLPDEDIRGQLRETGWTMKQKMRLIVVVSVILGLTAVFTACQNSATQSSDQANQAAVNSNAEAAHKTSRKQRGAGEKAREATAARETAPPAPVIQNLTVPQGTTLEVRLADSISSGAANVGSSFGGTLASSLVVNGIEIAPVGSSVSGKVTHVVSSGRLNRPAELGLNLTSLTPAGGSPVEISTSTWSQKAGSHKKRDEVAIGGGAAAGALIGALAGKGKGAAIGALVGGGAGTAGAALTGKKEIVLAPETKLSFTLSAPFTVQMQKAGQ